MLKRGYKLQDHAKQNRAALREMQRMNRIKRTVPPKPPAFKMQEFSGVQSRVFEPSPKTNESGTFTFMRKGDRSRRSGGETKRRPKSAWTPGNIPPSNYDCEKENSEHRSRAKPPVPRAADSPSKPRRNRKDFITENRNVAGRPSSAPQQRFRMSSEGETYSPHGQGHQLGEVPAYLRFRQQKWDDEEEEKRKKARDPGCPEGQKLMPEVDRQATLRVLKVSREQELKKLNALPLNVDTPSKIHRKQKIETRLKEIDDAVHIFSKSKVYTVV